MRQTLVLSGLPIQIQADTIQTHPDSALLTASSLTLGLPRPPTRFYRHGWQSWSLAAWTEPTPLPIQQPVRLHPMQTDPCYARETRPHGSWVGAVEFADGQILLLGALGLESHIQLNGSRLEAWSEAGPITWWLSVGDEAAVFSEYAARLANVFGKTIAKPAPRIWCSWYSLYTAIDEIILANVFRELGDLPFDVLQVDDGWQMDIGDWQSNAKFPGGMEALAREIRATGRRAGLWLAPLIATRSSNVFRHHPSWFLRDTRGRLVSAGFNWGRPLYALDTTHPEVTHWLVNLIQQVRSWGYDYLKLDFLYAGALPGKRYADVPREAAYRQALRILRDVAGPDAFLLACGAPIFPTLGICDALRIGPDANGLWESQRDAWLANPSTPATKNAIRTTLHRLWLHSLIHTDPDVVYFSSHGHILTPEQKQMLQDLALICNFRSTSDLPQWLTPDEREALRIFLTASPSIQRMGRYTFQIDQRWVDFRSAIALPIPPHGWKRLCAASLAWLGNQSWILKLIYQLSQKQWEQVRKNL